MKGPTTVKSAIVWGVSLLVLFALITYVNWFVYPFTSANPNFKDVETVFNSIQVPSDWTVIEESENKGIAGRQCPVESESMCFHKSKTYKINQKSEDTESLKNIMKTSGCTSVSSRSNEVVDGIRKTETLECMSNLVRVIGEMTTKASETTFYITTRSR